MPALTWESRVQIALSERLVGPYSDVGIVVGVIDGKDQYVHAQGYTDQSKSYPVSVETQFEIGELTKVFTALLMADMVKRGEVRLDDPISKYLPGDLGVPGSEDHESRLVDFATSSVGAPSGVPRISGFHRDALIAGRPWQLDGLSGAESASGGSRPYLLADVGFGVLGQALAKRHKTSYRQVLTDRLLRPLDLESTFIGQGTVAPERMAQGHYANLTPVPSHPHLAMFAGCEGLSSTASDLLKFLDAALQQKMTRFAFALRTSTSVRRATMAPGHLSAMGWAILQQDGREWLWRSSDVDGFSAWMGLEPASKRAIVVLANVGTPIASEIGFDLVNPRRTAGENWARVGLKRERLETMVGDYRLRDGGVFKIVRAGDHLTVDFGSQSPLPTYPTSDRRFVGLEGTLTLTFDFETELSARPVRVVVYRGNEIEIADRVEPGADDATSP